MAIEVEPLPLPSSADPSKFADFGREVKGVDPGQLTDEQFKEVQELLYKVRSILSSYKALQVSYRITQHDALLFRNANLTPEQKYVSQATDMMIGQRAQVFIGNGVRIQTLILYVQNGTFIDIMPFVTVFEHVVEYSDVAYGKGHAAAKHAHVVKGLGLGL